MNLAILFVILSALLLLALLLLARHQLLGSRPAGDLVAQLRPIDIDAFRNLTSEREHEYLRARLPAREFRRIHRERMLAALEYVRAAAGNAAILVKLAQAAREAEDPAIVTTAERLLENAIHLRLYALRTIPQLYVSMVLPDRPAGSGQFAEDYDLMKSQMVVLGCLQSPARGVSAGN